MSIWRVLVLVVSAWSVLGLGACKRVQEPEAKKVEVAQQSEVDPSQELIISGANTQVLLPDYEVCVHGYALGGKALSERVLSNPRFQRDEAMRCYQRWFSFNYLKAHKQSISPEILQQVLDAALKNNAVSTQAQLAQRLDVSADVLAQALQLSAVYAQLQHFLVESTDQQERAKLFAHAHRRMDIEYACFDNTPNDAEIDHFLHNNRTELMGHYAQNSHMYTTKARVQLQRYAFALKDFGDEAKAALAAQSFVSQAQDKPSSFAIDLCKSTASCSCSGCVAPLLFEEQGEHNMWAFTQAVGAFSALQTSADAVFVFRNAGFIPPEPSTLDSSLEREIATELLLKKPSESLLAKLKPALEQAAGGDFATQAKTLGGEYYHPQANYYYRLKAEGLPLTLWKILGETQSNETGIYSNPIVQDDKLCVFRVISMQNSSVSDYDTLAGSYFKERASDPGLDLVESFLQENAPRLTHLNMQALVRRYGQLQEDGKIQR